MWVPGPGPVHDSVFIVLGCVNCLERVVMASTDSQRRVKVYSFNEKMQWEDKGTGHVSVNYVQRLQSLIIMVRSEEDDSMLLESKVLPDRVYQKQEETLIVWTENESMDLALSFQAKADCNELWAKICDIQGHSPTVSVTQEDAGDMSDSRFDESSIIELPLCELGKLEEIFDLVSTTIPSPMHRESLVHAMERDNYIPKLLELFHICEDLENITGLHHLYNIFRTLFLINKASLLNIIFQEEHIVSVVGCLEYNPNKPHPVCHRDYLAQVAKHREVIPFNNPQLLNKVHQTYQVMYIQEVILPTPSLFEENMMSALNSFVLFNKAEIINTIQEDQRFLQELFAQLQDETIPEEKYRELAHLLREICTFSLALELEDRTKCYQNLSDYGFMSAVEGMLVCEESDVVGTAVDILMSISEFHCSIIRDYILQDTPENQSEDNQFMNILISLLVDGEYTDLEVVVVGLIKIIIDSEAIMAEPTPTLTSAQQVVEKKSQFLNYFYEHSMHRLMAPLMAQTAGTKVSRDTSQNAGLLSHILDILSLCVERHTYLIKNCIIKKNVLSRVLVLMTSSHTYLALAALRLCRKIVGLKDEFYNRYIVRNNLLAPIVKAFIANGRRYNLLNSAIIELFEYLRVENVKTLVDYVIENFWSTLESIEYVNTFKALKLKHEQEMDRRDNKDDKTAVPGILHGEGEMITRYRRDPRQMAEDEEAWFDEEEEEEITALYTNTLISSPTQTLNSIPLLSLTYNPPDKNRTSPPLPSAPHTSVPSSGTFTSISPSSTTFITTTTTTITTPTPSPPPPAPSPFTQVSYSPRPQAALNRAPLVESAIKTPIVTQALKSLVDYDEDSDDEDKSDENTESLAKRKKLDDT